MGRFGIWWRRSFAVLILAVMAAGVVYFAFPELILQAIVASARRSAGLQRRLADVAGHQIAYLEGGTGTPVVLLHGFGVSKDLWNDVAAQLTPEYRVIAPDLPGFGESPSREGEKHDAESQARRIREFLDAIGVREHHLGGSSMGGLISAVYGARYPDAVRSLMIAAAPGVRSPERSELFRRLEAGRNPLLIGSEADLDGLFELAFFRPPSIPGPIKRAMLRDAIARRPTYARIFDDLAALGEGALEAELPKITARTLIVWGTSDKFFHPSSADVFHSLIANSEKTILEECGHGLPRECPDALARRYREFLEKNAAGRP